MPKSNVCPDNAKGGPGFNAVIDGNPMIVSAPDTKKKQKRNSGLPPQSAKRYLKKQ